MIANKANESCNPTSSAQTRSQIELDQAISLNNKSVVLLKSGKVDEAIETVRQALQVIEHRVFSMIDTGLVTNANEDSVNFVLFQERLRVLLHSYYNLGMCKDKELESQKIYLRALQLYHQYGPSGHQDDLLYKKLRKKYCRPIYEALRNQ